MRNAGALGRSRVYIDAGKAEEGERRRKGNVSRLPARRVDGGALVCREDRSSTNAKDDEVLRATIVARFVSALLGFTSRGVWARARWRESPRRRSPIAAGMLYRKRRREATFDCQRSVLGTAPTSPALPSRPPLQASRRLPIEAWLVSARRRKDGSSKQMCYRGRGFAGVTFPIQ
eukprot:scaffold1005_cov403-Pinguiococcus_pyrenoidosus.AAC.3